MTYFPALMPPIRAGGPEGTKVWVLKNFFLKIFVGGQKVTPNNLYFFSTSNHLLSMDSGLDVYTVGRTSGVPIASKTRSQGTKDR